MSQLSSPPAAAGRRGKRALHSHLLLMLQDIVRVRNSVRYQVHRELTCDETLTQDKCSLPAQCVQSLSMELRLRRFAVSVVLRTHQLSCHPIEEQATITRTGHRWVTCRFQITCRRLLSTAPSPGESEFLSSKGLSTLFYRFACQVANLQVHDISYQRRRRAASCWY
jgi:hypothetical protein